MSEAADAAMIEAADADGRLRDDPLTDCPVDAAAAAEREREIGEGGQACCADRQRDGRRAGAIPNNSNTHTSFGAWSCSRLFCVCVCVCECECTYF